MGKTKIICSIQGRHNIKIIKLRPARNFLLNARKYSSAWNSIIKLILKNAGNYNLIVVITLNDLVLAEPELYSFIQNKINKNEFGVAYELESCPRTLRTNGQEAEYSERTFVLSVKPDDVNSLVEKLHDMDAMEIIVAKPEFANADISRILNNDAEDVGDYMKCCIYFNGIHIGLTIEMYSGDIEHLLSGLGEIPDLNLVFGGA